VKRVPYDPLTLVLIGVGLVMMAKLTFTSWGYGGWMPVGLVGLWLLMGVVVWDIIRSGVRL
jgi:hypothetical protein